LLAGRADRQLQLKERRAASRAPRTTAKEFTVPTDPRQWLEAERERLKAELELLAADERTRSVDERGYDNHLADDATDTLEVEKDLALEHHLKGLLRDVEAALQRVAEGRYGRCEECGQAINPERLAVLPATRYCLACSQRASARRAEVRS
jgi:RNA polymerase-binding transcription factor DksA